MLVSSIFFNEGVVETNRFGGGTGEKTLGRIKGLGELSIRVKDLDPSQEFYEEIVVLDVLRK